MKLILSGKQARHLRSLGHSLKPILQVGKSGITDGMIEQIRKALETHELIKVKLIRNSTVDIKGAAEEICSKAPCYLAHKIGKTLLLYNPREENPTIILPAPSNS